MPSQKCELLPTQLAKEKETEELNTYINANTSPAKIEHWLHWPSAC